MPDADMRATELRSLPVLLKESAGALDACVCSLFSLGGIARGGWRVRAWMAFTTMRVFLPPPMSMH